MTKSEAKKWGTAVEGATGGDALSQKVCGATSGSSNNCGTDDTAFLLGKGLALDTARGQLLSSALGRMSMSDVHRLKREVVDSEGIASPVRAMFSRQIPDGDTLLAGEMAGVDDGLVIQELSRPEELEKLQHELAKQVSKLAELGELKWLERLEAIETEELQEMKEKLRLKARKATEELRTQLEKVDGQQTEELKKEIESALGLAELEKGLEALKGLKGPEEIKKLRELANLDELEEEKLEELKKLGITDIEKELKEWEKTLGLKEKKEELVYKLAGQLKKEGTELGKSQQGVLGGIKAVVKLKELAAIRELKALGLEEQLRTLAEVKEVKALAEKQKAGGLEIQEGLQLTERMRGLDRRLVRLAAQKLEEIKELTQRQRIRKETNPQSIRKAASMLEEISVLRELRQLDELIPEEQLRTLAEVKDTIAQLEAQKLEEVKEDSQGGTGA